MTTADIKKQIPKLITQDEFDMFDEIWADLMYDYEEDDHDDPHVIAMQKIKILEHVVVGKNWSRVHKSKARDTGNIVRTFELGPGPVFGGIFKAEIQTDANDGAIIKSLFYNE